MSAYRLAAICCLLLALCRPALRAQEESPELKQAREAYDREMEFATRPIRDRYLLRLETLKRALGARGDARGALAVQDEVDSVKNANPTAEGVGRFAGVWRVTYVDGSRNIYSIKPEGLVTRTDDPPKPQAILNGRITSVGKDYLLELDDHVWIIRLSIVADKLAMDVFNKTVYPTGTFSKATGVRIGDRKP